MTLTKTLAVVLFAAAVASCKTLPADESETKGTITASQPDVITRIEYLPGKVLNNPFPIPDSAIVPDVAPLTEEHITGVDITPAASMATAIAWAKQYHDLGSTYNILRGWIIGVRAGQTSVKETPPVVQAVTP